MSQPKIIMWSKRIVEIWQASGMGYSHLSMTSRETRELAADLAKLVKSWRKKR